MTNSSSDPVSSHFSLLTLETNPQNNLVHKGEGSSPEVSPDLQGFPSTLLTDVANMVKTHPTSHLQAKKSVSRVLPSFTLLSNRFFLGTGS